MRCVRKMLSQTLIPCIGLIILLYGNINVRSNAMTQGHGRTCHYTNHNNNGTLETNYLTAIYLTRAPLGHLENPFLLDIIKIKLTHRVGCPR